MVDPNTVLEPSVCVMTLSWNDTQNTLDCLRSVYQLDYTRYRVLVIDNGSSEETVRAIRAAFPQVELIANPTNLGFGGGANVGFARAREHGSDHVLFINSDTVVERSLLKELVRAAQAHVQAGLLVPKIYYGVPGDAPPRIWSAGARWTLFPPRIKMIGRGKRDHPRYDQVRRLEYATGCALLIRCEVLEAVGGFDPIYWPAYQEDYDFSARVTQAGWEIWYAPAARIWHKETRSRQQRGARSKAYNLGKNTVPLYLRHFRPPLVVLFAHIAWVVLRELVKMKVRFLVPYLQGVHAGWRRHRFGEESE